MKIIKNSIKKISAFILLSGVMVSCNLDVVPPADITPETYWKTEKDAWHYLNGIYSALAPDIGIYEDAHTGDLYAQYPWETDATLFLEDGLSPSNDAGWDFSGIRRVNIFLQEVDGCDMKQELKQRMKAEARFFRAYDYLNKTLLFGKVPIIKEPLDFNAPFVPRDDVAKVQAFILEELSDIINDLPEDYVGGYLNEKGRVTKYAAMTLKARAALYFKDYTIAEKTAEDIINTNKFGLFRLSSLNANQQKEVDEMYGYVDFNAMGIDAEKFIMGMFSYESLWHDENALVSNPEYIFSRQYTDIDGHRDWSRYLALRPNQLGGWSSIAPTQILVDAYWTAKGEKFIAPSVNERKNRYEIIQKDLKNYRESYNGSISQFVEEKLNNGELMKYEYMQEFRNRDSRFYSSILFPFKGWYETEFGDKFTYEWIKGGNNESVSGYNFRKLTALKKGSNNAEETSANYPAMRYAEVLLIYAEARTHNCTYDEKVQKVLNDIRDRAGMPNVPSDLSREEGLLFIQAERRIELAGEGFRSNDLTRYSNDYWKYILGDKAFTMPDGQTYLTTKWSERMRLRPIPQVAIDLNPLLKSDQNPGYY